MVNRGVFFVMMFFGAFLIQAGGLEARRETILDFFDRHDTTRVFVAPAAEEAPAEGFDAAGLKAALEEAFRGRLSHRFDIVQNEKEADLRVDISVLEYFWTDADPVDMIAGLAGVSYDVLTKENYARLEAIIKLTDGPNGAKLWEEKLKSTITSKTLTKEEAPALSNERLAKMLIRNLFKKHPRK